MCLYTTTRTVAKLGNNKKKGKKFRDDFLTPLSLFHSPRQLLDISVDVEVAFFFSFGSGIILFVIQDASKKKKKKKAAAPLRNLK